MKQPNARLTPITADAEVLRQHPWRTPVEVFTTLANTYAVEKETIGRTPSSYSLTTLGKKFGLDLQTIRRIMNYATFRAEQLRRATNPGGFRYGRPSEYVLEDATRVTK